MFTTVDTEAVEMFTTVDTETVEMFTTVDTETGALCRLDRQVGADMSEL